MEYCEFLTEILKIDPTVRFVGMYDDTYKVITDGFQAGALAHLSREEMQNSVRYDMKRWETYKMFHNQLGDTKFAMVKFDKAILLTFSFNKDEYLRVSLEPDADYVHIINQIESLIMKNPLIR
jgi:hypothetical protein